VVPPRRTHSRRRLLALLALAIGALLLLAGPAAADVLTPESGGSKNADEIDSLFKIVLVIAIVVFVGVEGTLLYTIIRFRRSKNAVPAQIRGNTRLEIGWTVGASVIIVFLIVVSFVKLDSIKDPPATGPGGLQHANGALYAVINQPPPPGGGGLQIDVNGQQYLWRFTYPNGVFNYETMVVPVNTTVILKIRAQDVIHSWWIPKLGGKFDAVPGYTNETWFKITKPGLFKGQCAELCGRGHANMFAQVRAVSVPAYRSWLVRQQRQIQAQRAFAARARSRLQPNQ
jgi:cytochrome c oxidase subunit II